MDSIRIDLIKREIESYANLKVGLTVLQDSSLQNVNAQRRAGLDALIEKLSVAKDLSFKVIEKLLSDALDVDILDMQADLNHNLEEISALIAALKVIP